MPKKLTKKKGGDGLTERERAFAEERRKDPVAPGWLICERAGFGGTRHQLQTRYGLLMRKEAICAAVFAPRAPLPAIDDTTLREEIRHRMIAILRSEGATHDTIIRVSDKLLDTIPGGKVPLQVKNTGTFTLEGFVRAMGGAPEEDEPKALPEGEG